MRKFEFGAALVALALVATACFGGGGDEATLALDGAQIADVSNVPIADLPPEPGDPGEFALDEAEPAPEPDRRQVSYTYSDASEMAASMVLTPSDLAGEYPGLAVDALNTGVIDGLTAAARTADPEAAVELITSTGRLTGYESVLVTGSDAELADGALLVGTDVVSPIWSRVDLFTDEPGAEAWLAEQRAGHGDAAAEASGLPGAGYIATFTEDGRYGTQATRTEVGFSRGDMAATVRVPGDDAGHALAIARALVLRTYDVQQAAVPARDPYPAVGAVAVPQQHLDSFRAQAEVAVLDGGSVVWRWRESGVYRDADHYSCKAVSKVGGTETLEWDLTVEATTAWYYDDGTASAKVAALNAGVAALVGSCAVHPEYWRNRTVSGFDGLSAGRGVTGVGPAVAYQSGDAEAVNDAFGWSGADGEELVNYQEYVTEAGLSVASYHEVTLPRSVVEREWGDLPGSSSRLTVLTSRWVFDADGEDLELADFISVETEFGLGVGEEVALVPKPEPEPELDLVVDPPPAEEPPPEEEVIVVLEVVDPGEEPATP